MLSTKSKLIIQENVELARYSTFGIGGKARFFAKASSTAEMIQLLHFAKSRNIPFLVIGKGSNVLFDDRGFFGLVILNRLQFLERKGFEFHVGAGYSFPLLAAKMARFGLSGLEFASGIPGTVGGAVFMNAGANGMETKDHLLYVEWIDGEGKLAILKKEEIQFSYRFSSFQKMKGMIVSAAFLLQPDSSVKDRGKQQIAYRLKTQPIKSQSCGCIFRNPIEGSAGYFIEQCGLKGERIGDATVSPKHANFIVNEGKAKATDVMQLIQLIQTTVSQKAGIYLQPEIRFISYESGSTLS